MRKSHVFVAIAFAVGISTDVAAAELTVKVTDIREQSGTLKLALIDSQAAWDGQGKPVATTGGKPSGDTLALHLKDLKPGAYAVRVMHDANDNGKLDTNAMGMPIEGYGFSNNPQVMRGAHFDEATFELGPSDQEIVIQLR